MRDFLGHTRTVHRAKLGQMASLSNPRSYRGAFWTVVSYAGKPACSGCSELADDHNTEYGSGAAQRHFPKAVIESCQIGLTRNWSFAAFVSDVLVVEHAVADGHSDHRYNRLMTILCCE